MYAYSYVQLHMASNVYECCSSGLILMQYVCGTFLSVNLQFACSD